MTTTLRAFVLALITLGAASCAHGTHPGSANDSAAEARAKAVKFAECMRANGIRDFPDPDASGGLSIETVLNGSSVDPNSRTWKTALGACQDLEPPGFTGKRRSPEQQRAAVRFAACVRNNGIKDFPDPEADQPLVDTSRIPSLSRAGSRATLTAAMRACSSLAGAAGVSGQ